MDKAFRDELEKKALCYEALPIRYLEETGCKKHEIGSLKVSECKEFADIGIKVGSTLYFDLETPFEEGAVSAFAKVNPESEKNDFKLSRTVLEGWTYLGQLAFMFVPMREVSSHASSETRI